jgi:hypothetical protein
LVAVLAKVGCQTFRSPLKPACASLDAVAVIRQFDLQAGTAYLNGINILNRKSEFMKKVIILAMFAAVSMACGAETSDNTAKKKKGPETKQFNSQPMDNSGKPIPGIPDPKKANISNQAPGATPTPGIPDPKKADITNREGATPTPGIPSEAERKKMMEEMKKNPNAVNTAPANPPAGKSTSRGPLNRPRKVGN